MQSYFVAVVACALCGCLSEPTFVCRTADACGAGVCEAADPELPLSVDNAGTCSEATGDCPSGYRYAEPGSERACVACGAVGEYCCTGACNDGLTCTLSRCTCVQQLVGDGTMCILRGNGTVACFRLSVHIGEEGVAPYTVVEVPELTGATAISASGVFICGHMPDNRARCVHAMGNMPQPGSFDIPGEIVGIGGGCAIMSDRSVTCLNGDGAAIHTDIADVEEVSGNAQQSLGHMCFVKTDGSVWCVGSNTFGQLGDGTTKDKTSPVRVEMPVAKHIDVSVMRTCAIAVDGSVWCWGRNDYGELGDGIAGHRLSPSRILDINDAIQVEADINRACVRRASGVVWCWGLRTVSDPIQPPSPVGNVDRANGLSLNPSFTCTLQSTTLDCWGGFIPDSQFANAPYNRAGSIGRVCD